MATSTENFTKFHREKVVKNMKNHGALVNSCYFECSSVSINIQNRELVYLKLCHRV